MAKKKGTAVSDGYGLGLDYLVVDPKTLEPLSPISIGNAGKDVTWSINEARTGIRLSTTTPEKKMDQAGERLSLDIRALSKLIEEVMGGMLLPTGAHPFAAISKTGIQGTAADAGWPRTCASSIEISFADEQAFGRLHTAIRMVLPLVPAISGSSPFLNGKRAEALSARVFTLMQGQGALPEVTGAYIPEVALDQADYFRIVLEPIARALAARGLGDSMDYQLANTRAAVPSFDRGVIAVTVADTQECASSDAAVAEMLIAVVNAMKDGRWVSNYLQRAWHETDLRAILQDVARLGGEAVIANRDYLLMFGMMRESATAAELWRHLYQHLRGELSEASRIRIAHILDHGCLAQRILRSTGEKPTRDRIIETYRELCACLKEDRPFV